MSSSLSEAATYEPERKYLEKRRGKLFSFLQAAGLSRFFTFFCENLRAVWVVRLTVIVCFFFRAPSVPFIATRGSSSVEETQAAVFIMLTRLQWKGWQRSQKETDTSAVTWNTHTHTLSQAVLKGDYGVLLGSSWPQLAGAQAGRWQWTRSFGATSTVSVRPSEV